MPYELNQAKGKRVVGIDGKSKKLEWAETNESVKAIDEIGEEL